MMCFADPDRQEIDPDAEPQPMENTHTNAGPWRPLVVSNSSSRAGSVPEESAPSQPKPRANSQTRRIFNGDIDDDEKNF